MGLWWGAFPEMETSAASGGSTNCLWCSSEVSVPSINKRREGGRQCNVNVLPPRGVWAGLGYSSASGSWLHAINPVAVVSVLRAVWLPSRLCSYSPTESSLHGPQACEPAHRCTQTCLHVENQPGLAFILHGTFYQQLPSSFEPIIAFLLTWLILGGDECFWIAFCFAVKEGWQPFYSSTCQLVLVNTSITLTFS